MNTGLVLRFIRPEKKDTLGLSDLGATGSRIPDIQPGSFRQGFFDAKICEGIAMEKKQWQCQIDNESSHTCQIHLSGGYVRDGLVFVQDDRMMVHDEKKEEDDDEDADDVCND